MKADCPNCGNEFEYNPAEVLAENEDDGNGDPFRFYYTECPKCSYYVEVEIVKGLLLTFGSLVENY